MGIFDKLKELIDPATIITDTVMGVAKGAADIVDQFVTNPEEKAAIALELQKYQLEVQRLAMEKDAEFFSDRQSARELGKTDKWTPRILTILFTIAFFGVVSYMLSKILGESLGEMSDFTLMFVSTVLGSITTIMTQIISYYFGASRGGDEQGTRIADAIKK